MTKKLYYEDGKLDRCMATVLDCRKNADGGYDVLLDQTVIFPEGGGQPSDTGRLNAHIVTHASEEGADIWHSTDAPFDEGAKVEVFMDMERRGDHSQQHTGEHIVSGLASSLFGAKNVGFHMAEGYATLDLDAALSDVQMRQLEEEANKVVQANIPVSYRFVDASELPEISLRKQAKGLQGEVRIVYVGNVDSCTCCGTHCASAGEVGYIKFTSWQNYKGGVRLWFLCGMRAVRAAAMQQGRLEALARRYSVKEEDVYAAVEKQGAELASLKYELKKRTDALLGYRADEALQGAQSINGIKLVIQRLEGFTMPDLKLFADKLLLKERCVALLFAENQETLQYQLGASKGLAFSMREACAAVNAATGGKGGGRDDFAQGSAKLQGGLEETLLQLERYFCAKLKEERG